MLFKHQNTRPSDRRRHHRRQFIYTRIHIHVIHPMRKQLFFPTGVAWSRGEGAPFPLIFSTAIYCCAPHMAIIHFPCGLRRIHGEVNNRHVSQDPPIHTHTHTTPEHKYLYKNPKRARSQCVTGKIAGALIMSRRPAMAMPRSGGAQSCSVYLSCTEVRWH